MDLIDSQTTRVIAKALDGLSKRHTAIASNIANAETPGYRAIRVSFENNLEEAIAAENSTDPASKHLPKGSLKTTNPAHHNPKPNPTSTADAKAMIERSEFEYRYDKNGVDIEHEMAQLAKNTQRYQALSRMEGNSFSALRNVIKGGGM